MNMQIFSLPQQFVIPDQDWLETPDVKDRVNQAVRSYFANWTVHQLSWFKKVSEVTCWISLAGIAMAAYIGSAIAKSKGRVWDILYFPRFLAISGLTFVVCLIGYKIMRRELIARLKRTCLAIEDYLIPLKKPFEDLKPLLVPFKDRSQPHHSIAFATYQSLYNQLQSLPAKKEVDQSIEDLATKLHVLHLGLFGDLRRFGQGEQLTDYWIQHNFKNKLGSRLKVFGMYATIFQEYFLKLQKDPQNQGHQTCLLSSAQRLCELSKPVNELSTTDLLEQSRQSIAAFRSSLRV